MFKSLTRVSKLTLLFIMMFSFASMAINSEAYAFLHSREKLVPNAHFDHGLTKAQVGKIIGDACMELNWQPKKLDNNTIQARIVVRNKHTVIVNIPYTNNSYSIEYSSSINMDEKPDGKIHRNYNNWVKNLSDKINIKLSDFAFSHR